MKRSLSERKKSRFWLPYLLGLLIASLGCIVENNAVNGGTSGVTNVGGTVGGQSFSVASGSAEPGLDGTYAVTLSDTTEFTCTAASGLPMNHLQVVIGEIEAEETFDADGRVFFNVFENGVASGTAADSGTVTITRLDAFSGVIEGTIDAEGPDGSIAGDFSVDICSN